MGKLQLRDFFITQLEKCNSSHVAKSIEECTSIWICISVLSTLPCDITNVGELQLGHTSEMAQTWSNVQVYLHEVKWQTVLSTWRQKRERTQTRCLQSWLCFPYKAYKATRSEGRWLIWAHTQDYTEAQLWTRVQQFRKTSPNQRSNLQQLQPAVTQGTPKLI